MRRKVFFVPGFDPRDAASYWALFRRESRLTAERRHREIAVGEPEADSAASSLTWTVRARGEGWSSETDYTLLRWNDVVAARFPRSNWRRLLDVSRVWSRLLAGAYPRHLARASPKFATVIIGVHLIYVVLVALAVAAGLFLATLLVASGAPGWLAAVAGIAGGYAVLAGLNRAARGRPFYVPHLVDDTTFTHDHAAGAVPDMDRRLDLFADQILAASHADYDEILVVGHSSGAFLGCQAIGRALSRVPSFGQAPILITMGGVIPWLSLDPRAGAMRRTLAEIEAAPSIRWIDVDSDWDWLACATRGWAGTAGPHAPPRQTTIRTVLRDLSGWPERRKIKYNLFRLHFQLLMSSFEPGAFDYISLVTGPDPVPVAIKSLWGRGRPAHAGT